MGCGRTAVGALILVAIALLHGCASGPEAGERQVGAGAGASVTPLKDGVAFSPVVTHPYLPLSTVRLAELRSANVTMVCEVQRDMRSVGGVQCLVLAEKEYKNGSLFEISYNYFAQDAHGNVYYFGEDVDDYKDGQIVGHGGAWLVGRNAAEPCLFMPAQLAPGFQFKRENSPPDAEEWDEIDSTTATLSTPAGAFKDVLVIKEGDRPGRWEERKYYARGVGIISENRSLNLAAMPQGASAAPAGEE
jgi:hypothetical protein